MSAQAFEREFWGDCANTFHEEQKQLVYTTRMGLVADWSCAHPPEFDLGGRAIVDVGGGPASLLLKTRNGGRRLVIDPCEFPGWVYLRYAECGIDVYTEPGETWEVGERIFDEGWIYNVLQHVEDPERVIDTLRHNTRLIRIFEWIDIPAYPGHPHTLRAEDFYQWLGGGGMVEEVNEAGAVGRAFYGVFAVR